MLLFLLAFSACEREFIPDIPLGEPELVVEGFIEAGDRPTPPFLILTRSVPFFQEIDAEDLDDLFVHGAEIRVSDGSIELALQEICLDQLTPEQRALLYQALGISADSIAVNFCLYTDLSGRLTGTIGKTYHLQIRVEGRELRSSTFIPSPVPLDSLKFREPPGEPTDTLAQLRAWISDPPGPNLYRYFTQVNEGALQAGSNSVIDDRLFDGQSFEFPLPKAEARNTDFDPATFGLYRRGDTVLVKWASIDREHFAFWNTLEFNASNQGPFSSYTRVDSNIEGGLGIWGGLSAVYYELIVPEE